MLEIESKVTTCILVLTFILLKILSSRLLYNTKVVYLPAFVALCFTLTLKFVALRYRFQISGAIIRMLVQA